MVMESRQLLPELILSRTQENSIRDDEAGPISNLIPKQENRMDPSNKSKREHYAPTISS